MAFLDEEEAPAPAGGGRPPRRPAPDRQRQIVVRRAVGVGVIVLLLILIVLGVRGCLNARKTRSFENYVSDLNAITTQTKQLSDDFFTHLRNPGSLSALSFEAQINSYRGTAEALKNRVESLDTPGDLNAAQGQLNEAYELRSDGLSGIADQMKTALGTQGRTAAINSIANYMRYFLASDVLYQRAEAQTDSVLRDQNINEKAPASQFLPEPASDWLDPLKISADLAQVSGGKQATTGIHGLGLLQTSIGGTVLSTSTANTLSNASEVDVDVQNQGDSEETDIGVSFQLTGGAQTVSGDATIPRLAAGGTGTAKIPIQPAPETGTQLTLEVTVQPVPGEQVASNNRSTYQVTFK